MNQYGCQLMMVYIIIYKIMNIGNRIVYNIDIANIARPSNELNLLVPKNTRNKVVNKITTKIWQNIIDDIRETIRLNLITL